MRRGGCKRSPHQRAVSAGYAMVGLLVAIGVMGVLMTLVLPYWRVFAKREKEAELIFRGEQYIRAIELYQRQFPGAYPNNLGALVEQRFLRRLYADPITGGTFEVLTQATVGLTPTQGSPSPDLQSAFATASQFDQANSTNTPGNNARGLSPTAGGSRLGAGGIIGVVSRSPDTSMRAYNERTRYDEWFFVYLPQASQPGVGVVPPPAETPNPSSAPPGSSNRFSNLDGVAETRSDLKLQR